MKTHLALLIACSLLFGACAERAVVTPKPNVQPAIVSNNATRKSISETRTHIKRVNEIHKAEGDALRSVEQDLDELLKQ